MPIITCLARDDPARIYEYCPSLGAAILFAILFTLSTLTYTIQSFMFRHWPAWVLIMAGLWEMGGYIARSVSVYHQANSGMYMAQFLLILLAPLWINAYVYMVLGRMIHFFMLNDRIFGIRARRITIMFVIFDITAFVVQLTGGIMTSGTDQPADTIKLGLNIYTGGVALQLAFIATFIGLTVRFWQLLKKQDQTQPGGPGARGAYKLATTSASNEDVSDLPAVESKDELILERGVAKARPLLIVVCLALFLIILRNVFRLAEYAKGGVHGNTMTHHEWFLYVFDAVPMLFAITVLGVYHPGRVLQGYRSDFSEEDKTRKLDKKAKRVEKKQIKKAKEEWQANIKRMTKAGTSGEVGPTISERSYDQTV